MADEYNVVDKGDWFKIHHSGWLEGTMRSKEGMSGDELAAWRGVWADLLALVSRSRLRDGSLRHAIGYPMNRDWIANTLNISRKLLDVVVEDGVNDKNRNGDRSRIEIWDDGTIYIVNWKQYQAKAKRRTNHVNKETGEMPMDADEKEAKSRLITRNMAYKYPEDAEIGKKKREFEESIKPKNDKGKE